MRFRNITARLAASVVALAATTAAGWTAETVGFVTHSQGDPFIQQIIDGAQAAAKDLGVTLNVAQQQGSAPEGQLKLVQNFVNAGAQGVATSVPGESMAGRSTRSSRPACRSCSTICSATSVNAPYVGEKSVESGRMLGKMVVDKLGGAAAKGTVILGNCFPGFPVLENRAKGVQESLKAAAGLTVLGPFDVKVSEVDNYNQWEQLYAANPDAVALIGLCAPDITSLGKLNAANGDKFVAGGYDMTELNLKAIKEGHAFVTIGQSAYVQGYLPVALCVNAIRRASRSSPASTIPASQVVTAEGVDMGNGLPAIGFDEAHEARRRSGSDRGLLQGDGAHR